MERKIWARAQHIKTFLPLQGTFEPAEGLRSWILRRTARPRVPAAVSAPTLGAGSPTAGHSSVQSRALPWQAAVRHVFRLAAREAPESRAGDTSWLSQEAGMSRMNF